MYTAKLHTHTYRDRYKSISGTLHTTRTNWTTP